MPLRDKENSVTVEKVLDRLMGREGVWKLKIGDANVELWHGPILSHTVWRKPDNSVAFGVNGIHIAVSPVGEICIRNGSPFTVGLHGG